MKKKIMYYLHLIQFLPLNYLDLFFSEFKSLGNFFYQQTRMVNLIIPIPNIYLFNLSRAVLSPAKIVLIDEATANVDTETDNQIQQVIRIRRASYCSRRKIL